MTLLSRDRARCIFCVTGLLQVACAFVVLGTNLAMRASDASCIVIDRDITEVVKSVVIPRRAADAKSDDASETPREKLMVEVAHGSIEVIVDAKVVTAFNDSHIAQMTGYLAITGLRLAILLNFKSARLEWKRVVK